LARVEGFWFVNADDETHIARFSTDDRSPGEFFDVVPGPLLPLEHRARKKAKPDLEALAVIAERGGATRLLTVPSGSKSNRIIGAVIPCLKGGELGSPIAIDFGALYAELVRRIGPLNIEGAVFSENRLVLLNRGNAANSKNAVIVVDGSTFAHVNEGSEAPVAIESIREVDLGSIGGHAFGFTDACRGKGGKLLFLGAAEGVKDSYEDGSYLGAVFGALDSEGKILHMNPIDCPMKPEGLWFMEETNSVRIVTDSDDASVPAEMFELSL
jgi:hypothetical protein